MANSDQHKIVILENNLERRDLLRSFLSGNGYTTICFEKVNICLDNMPVLNPDLVVIGNLVRDETLRFINALKILDGKIPVLIVSDDAIVQKYVNDNRFDAISIRSELSDAKKLKEVINGVLASRPEKKGRTNSAIIIGNHPEIIKIKKIIHDMAHSDEPILIYGEPGTGKELIAKTFCLESQRKDNPFGRLDVESFLLTNQTTPVDSLRGIDKETNLPLEDRPPDIIEIGSNDSLGLADKLCNGDNCFELVNPGTLFIKNIDKLPLNPQAELLIALENKNTFFTNDDPKSNVNLRIIASTSRNFTPLIEKKEFREDLYYRLNVIRVVIPPLRQRLDDIPLLADYFVDKYCNEHDRSHFSLSDATKDIFSRYNWPGNVDELESWVKRIVLTGQEEKLTARLDTDYNPNAARGRVVTFLDIKGLNRLSNPKTIRKYLVDLNQLSLKDICSEFLEKTEKKVMQKALEKTNWNRKKAAMLLDISYKSMLNKIKAYKLA